MTVRGGFAKSLLPTYDTQSFILCTVRNGLTVAIGKVCWGRTASVSEKQHDGWDDLIRRLLIYTNNIYLFNEHKRIPSGSLTSMMHPIRVKHVISIYSPRLHLLSQSTIACDSLRRSWGVEDARSWTCTHFNTHTLRAPLLLFKEAVRLHRLSRQQPHPGFVVVCCSHLLLRRAPNYCCGQL